MGVNERGWLRRSQDKLKIAYLLNHHPDMTQGEIAVELGLSEATVSRDIASIRAELDKDIGHEVEALRQRELAKIQQIEDEAWLAWHKSQEPMEHKATRAREGLTGESTTRELKTVTRNGDPRYLDKIAWCIERRCKLLGLDAPTKIAPTEPDGQTPYRGVMMVEVVRPPADA